MTQTSNIVTVKLGQLVPLNEVLQHDETALLAAKREIDETQVEAYSYVDTDVFPPIKVAAMDEGKFLLIGGYHRTTSRKIKIERELKLEGLEDKPEEEQLTALKKNLTEEQKLKAESRYNLIEMKAELLPKLTNTVDVVQAAYEDNLKNGLSFDKKSRTRIAVWLYLEAEKAGVNPSYRKIAEKVGIKGPTLFEAVKKEKDKLQQAKEEAKQQELPEGEGTEEAIEEALIYDKATSIKKAKALINALSTYHSYNSIMPDTVLINIKLDDLREACMKFNEGVTEKSDKLDLLKDDLVELGIMILACRQDNNVDAYTFFKKQVDEYKKVAKPSKATVPPQQATKAIATQPIKTGKNTAKAKTSTKQSDNKETVATEGQ